MPIRHFLQFSDLSAVELKHLLGRASELKQARDRAYRPLAGHLLAMLFDKPSTRTRVSFEAGISQLGGSALFLAAQDTQLRRGETIEDVARVVSRMVDLVVIRTFAHESVERFASHSQVPVINGLTDDYHPCQILADVFTFIERRGDMKGCTVAWVGDGNNVCRTWLQAAELLEFNLRVAAPVGYQLQGISSDRLAQFDDPIVAVRGADLVTTDVWVSMGGESSSDRRRLDFAPFSVDANVMREASSDALFMHCLPAHRGEEVSAEVIDGPQSVVWDEAENRLHTQKALMEFLLLGVSGG